MAQPPSSPALAPLLSAIARQDLFREPESATATFEALARYYAERLLEVGLLEDFGVACARHARVRLQQSLTAQLWLQRVRSLGQATRGDYEQELQALLEARRKTGRLQALPEAKQQEPMKVARMSVPTWSSRSWRSSTGGSGDCSRSSSAWSAW